MVEVKDVVVHTGSAQLRLHLVVGGADTRERSESRWSVRAVELKAEQRVGGGSRRGDRCCVPEVHPPRMLSGGSIPVKVEQPQLVVVVEDGPPSSIKTHNHVAHLPG